MSCSGRSPRHRARRRASWTCACRRPSPTRASGPRCASAASWPGVGRRWCSPSTWRSVTRPSCWRPTPPGVGYLLKDRVADVAEFVDARAPRRRGRHRARPGGGRPAAGPQPAPDPLARLTAREREVLALMAEGRSNTAIARALVVSDGAVEKHVTQHLRQARPAARPTATTAGCSPCCATWEWDDHGRAAAPDPGPPGCARRGRPDRARGRHPGRLGLGRRPGVRFLAFQEQVSYWCGSASR